MRRPGGVPRGVFVAAAAGLSWLACNQFLGNREGHLTSAEASDAGEPPPAGPCTPPHATAPLQGTALSGRIARALRPTLRWNPGNCAAVEVGLGPGWCSDGGCLAAIAAHGKDGQYELPTPLETGAQQPVGRRYTWGVRGCDASGSCQPWDTRVLEAGRALGDVTGDGLADVVIASRSCDGPLRDTLHVFAAGERFNLELPFPIVTNRLAVLDFDDDGYADIVGAWEASSPAPHTELWIAYGSPQGPGKPSMLVQRPFLADVHLELALGLDRENTSKLVATWFPRPSGTVIPIGSNPEVTVYGAGGRVLMTRHAAEAAADATTCGDVDGDGFPELAVLGAVNRDEITLYSLTSDASLQPARSRYPVIPSIACVPGRQGQPRIALLERISIPTRLDGRKTGVQLKLWYPRESRSEAREVSFNTTELASAGDMDGDGIGDLALAMENSLDVMLGPFDLTLTTTASPGGNGFGVVGDYTGDGREQLVFAAVGRRICDGSAHGRLVTTTIDGTDSLVIEAVPVALPLSGSAVAVGAAR